MIPASAKKNSEELVSRYVSKGERGKRGPTHEERVGREPEVVHLVGLVHPSDDSDEVAGRLEAGGESRSGRSRAGGGGSEEEEDGVCESDRAKQKGQPRRRRSDERVDDASILWNMTALRDESEAEIRRVSKKRPDERATTHHISALVKLDSALGTVLNHVLSFSSISSNHACSGTPARQARSPGVTRCSLLWISDWSCRMRMTCRETSLEAEGSPGIRTVSVMFSSSRREGY